MSNYLILEIIDTIIGLFGLYAKLLNARLMRIGFVIFGVTYIYWIERNIYNELYAQAFFSFITLVINWYGFFKWKKKGIN